MVPRLELEIRRARHGDLRAFRNVTEALGPGLVRYVTAFLRGDEHAANDVVQETFVEAWRNLPRMEGAEQVRAWLYHVARCRAITWLRRRGPPPGRLDPSGGPDLPRERLRGRASRARGALPDPDDPASGRADLAATLRDAIARLPLSYSGPVQLHYVHGFGTGETARLLGLPRTAVKMRLHRARRYLRRLLEREARRIGLAREPERKEPRPEAPR